MQLLQRNIPQAAAQLPVSLVACCMGWGLGLPERASGRVVPIGMVTLRNLTTMLVRNGLGGLRLRNFLVIPTRSTFSRVLPHNWRCTAAEIGGVLRAHAKGVVLSKRRVSAF